MKVWILWISILLPYWVTSQNEFVINSGGTTYNSDGWSNSYSIGEPLAGFQKKESIVLFHGFWGGVSTMTTSVAGFNNPDFTMNIFPNPTCQSITIQIDGTGTNYEWTLFITDLSGAVIKRKTAAFQFSKQQDIHVTDIPAGVYFLSIMNQKLGARTLPFIKH